MPKSKQQKRKDSLDRLTNARVKRQRSLDLFKGAPEWRRKENQKRIDNLTRMISETEAAINRKRWGKAA